MGGVVSRCAEQAPSHDHQEGDPAVTQRRRIFGAALLALTAGLAMIAAKPSQNTAVTSILAGSPGGTYQIASDGNGPYANATNLKSLISSAGDYQLGGFDLSGATRLVYLDFDMPIAGSGPNGGAPVAPPSGLYNVNLASPCSDYGLSFLKVAPGDTIECGMIVQFAYDGQNYDLHENGNASYPETNPVKITCTSAAGSPCSAWTVQPSGVSGYDVANLAVEQTGKHGVITEVNQGNFLVSFLFTIAKPS
jgi:hypothetical protein